MMLLKTSKLLKIIKPSVSGGFIIIHMEKQNFLVAFSLIFVLMSQWQNGDYYEKISSQG